MATELLESPLQESAPPTHGGEYLRASGLSWADYRQVLKIFQTRRFRITYDRGELEIMTVSPRHERYKGLLARLVSGLALEFDIPLLSLGNMTCSQEDLDRGFEPDDCWYIQHEAEMRDRDEIEFGVDPSPDLALEVDVSRSALDRIGIHSAFGVPEVWRLDAGVLHVHVLQDGQYVESQISRAFPKLRLGRIAEALQKRGTISDTQIVREFLAAVRQDGGL